MVVSNPMAGQSESVRGPTVADVEASPGDSEQVLEVLGTVPVWVLGGMRLERQGERTLPNGWIVGVYQMDVAEYDPKESSLSN